MKRSNFLALGALGGALFLAACGGDGASAAGAATGGSSQSASATAPAVAPTGNVMEVQMVSGRGELFEPGDLTVQRGDVVRFVLASGVHNVSFPADRNPSGVALPKSSPYLQAPGQTWDLLVDLPPGEYFYQCDPHLALGMVGTITVTD
jgi:plastocyanin